MNKIKSVTARYDDADIAPRLPNVVEIGYEHIYYEDIDGEFIDALKPDIVTWLRVNVRPRSKWQFCCYIGAAQTYLDPITGEEYESICEQFRVRFARENDAFNFKMRWYGAAP